MPITIIDAAETRVERLILMLYANPSAGKTTLALTAEKPLLLDFDGGAHRAANRSGKDMVKITSWGDIAGMSMDDLKPYSTIIVDTVGTCLDQLSGALMREDAKNRNAGGGLSLKGYGVLKSRFKDWLNRLKETGLDVILIAHLAEEQRGDDTVERIVAPGSAKQDVYREADLIGRIIFKGRDRILTFDPGEAAYGKNCGLEPYTLPVPAKMPTLLAEVIAQAKGRLNDTADAEAKENERLDKLKARCEALTTADEFNAEVERMMGNGAGPVDKQILMEAAKAQQFTFDKEAKTFSAPEAKAAKGKPQAEAPF